MPKWIFQKTSTDQQGVRAMQFISSPAFEPDATFADGKKGKGKYFKNDGWFYVQLYSFPSHK